MSGPSPIWFVTTSLVVGGAEMMLYRLLSRLDRRRFTPEVVCLIPPGPMSERIRDLGVPIRTLNMRPGAPNPVPIARLARWLTRERPAAIQTWMYHADLVGGLAAKLAGGIPVAWGLRQSDLSPEGNRWLTLQTVKTCARLSRWLPSRIVCSSEAARRAHAAVGYAPDKMVTISNGLDLSQFQPDTYAPLSVRRELDIPQDAMLVGIIGRFHPQKDHQNFVQAAGILHRHLPNAYFLLCGDGMTWDNAQLTRWITAAEIRDRCRLVGRRHDVPRLTAALDLAVSSSFGESFPNVVAEAMSCEVPCVVTDVGDSAFIVGRTGGVVPPRNAAALAAACRGLLGLDTTVRAQLGAAARQRIKTHFELSQIVARYEDLYTSIIDRSTAMVAQA